MPVIPKVPPAASRATLERVAPGVASSPFGAPVEGGQAAPDNLIPHRAFAMTAEECALATPPSGAARYVGWRYLILPVVGVAVATVGEDEASGRHTLMEVNRGAFAEASPQALRATLAFGARQPGEYEIAFLGIPALYVEALWLRSATGLEDYFVPFGDVPPGLAPEVYSLDVWLSQLQAVARRILELAERFPTQR